MYGNRLLIAITFILLALTAHAQPTAAQAQPPELVKIGIYVMRLSDLNPSTQSFSADFWVWTLSSANSQSHPIETLRVQNAKQFWASEPKQTIVGGLRWGYREFVATIVYDWDMQGFPFDRHELEIAVGETEADTRRLVYEPNTSDSGIVPEIRLTGWRLGRATLRTGVFPYLSRFGDPTVAQPLTRWTEAHTTFEISRTERWASFFKLTFPAYVAFVMMMLSFLMGRAEFSSRISLLVGSLFATAVSTRTSAAALGDTPRFTLVEQIHLLVIGYILASACVALLTHYVAEDKAAVAGRIDLVAALVTGATFVAWNLLLIAEAVRF
jgi:hypothetical protein